MHTLRANEYVKIHNPTILNDKLVSCELSCSTGVKQYLLSDKLYVEYEKNISALDPSILQIPAVSGVITIAWATGADVYVAQLDKTYLKFLRNMTPNVKYWRSNLPSSTKIHVGDATANSFHNKGYGLLFTCGIDSVASYVKHRHEKPSLIHVWGTDVPSEDEETWRKMHKRLSVFAAREKATLHIIRSNIPRVANQRLLYERYGLSWWQQVAHSIVLTGLCAPLSGVASIGTLFVASAVTSEFRFPGGSRPLHGDKMSWGDISVIHDNYEISRQLKIRQFIKDYLRDQNSYLKVCNSTHRPESNCRKCTKCLRTITELALEGIDPNRCGFKNVNKQTFDHIRRNFVNERFFRRSWIIESEGDFINRMGEVSFWQDIQKHTPANVEDCLPASQDFFRWFKDFDIQGYLERTNNNIQISSRRFLYNCTLAICAHMPKDSQRAITRLLGPFTRILSH